MNISGMDGKYDQPGPRVELDHVHVEPVQHAGADHHHGGQELDPEGCTSSPSFIMRSAGARNSAISRRKKKV